MKILVLCTGNSCRSQMAEGFLKRLRPDWETSSAGTHPATIVHPMAIAVMRKVGIDLSDHTPEPVEQYLDQPFDYVITVCDDARETCPVFVGTVGEQLHIGFPDPSFAVGSREQRLAEFQTVRDAIWKRFEKFVAEAEMKRDRKPVP